MYKEVGFHKLLNSVNAQPQGSLLDIERYRKTSQTLDIPMRMYEGIMDQLLPKVKSDVSCSVKSLINVYGFYKFIRIR